MKIKPDGKLAEWLEQGGKIDLLDQEHELDDREVQSLIEECGQSHPAYTPSDKLAWAAYTILCHNVVSKAETEALGDAGAAEFSRFARVSEAQAKAFWRMHGKLEELLAQEAQARKELREGTEHLLEGIQGLREEVVEVGHNAAAGLARAESELKDAVQVARAEVQRERDTMRATVSHVIQEHSEEVTRLVYAQEMTTAQVRRDMESVTKLVSDSLAESQLLAREAYERADRISGALSNTIAKHFEKLSKQLFDDAVEKERTRRKEWKWTWAWRAIVALALLGLLVVEARGQQGHDPIFFEVQDEGTRAKLWAAGMARLNFTGGGITCSWDGANGRVNCNVPTGGGGASWDAITNPLALQSLSMTTFPTTWTWGNATSTTNLFTATDTASNTGTGYLATFNTATASTLKVFRLCYRGTTDCVTFDTSTLSATGAANINATQIQNVAISGTPVVGQIPIASSGTAAAWGDPLVSGITAHDAPGGTTNPVATGGYASAAAPADVSADVDIVRMWSLRNGSPVMNLATGGTLYDARQIRALTGSDVVTANAGTGTFGVNLTQVSGTAITLGQKTMSASLPVVLPSDQFLDTTATGGIAALNGEVNVSPIGEATAGVQVTGTWVATLSFEATVDNTNYFAVNAYPVAGGAPVTSTTANGNWQVPDAGYKKIRVRASAYTSGTATVTIISSAGPNVQIVGVREALPAGTNNIGDVDIASALPTGANTIGAVTQASGPWTSNLTQYGGVAVGAGNAVHVQPGTAAVFQVQSNSANLATQAELDKLTLAQGSTTSGQEGTLVQAAVTTAAPTYTTGQTSPLSLTTAGGLRVDGSGVTQPVSGTVTVGTFPDNEPINVAQINGVAPLMGNGVTGTGSQRVTIASDNSAVSGMGVGATGAAPPANANFTGGLASGATGGFLTGITVCDSFVNVNVSTATTTLLVTGVSARHVRVCSVSLVTAAANNVALISGTGATCGTGTTGMNGGTTAATGWNFAANGGLTQGSGLGEVNRTNATGDSVCVVTSAATQLSGRISYTIY